MFHLYSIVWWYEVVSFKIITEYVDVVMETVSEHQLNGAFKILNLKS